MAISETLAIILKHNSKGHLELLVDDQGSLPRQLPLEIRPICSLKTNHKLRASGAYFYYLEEDREFPHKLGWNNFDQLTPGEDLLVSQALGIMWEQQLGDLPALFSPWQLDLEKELCFYGGAFNPWHEGHSECLKQCPVEQIVVIPDENPWKEARLETNVFKSLFELSHRIASYNCVVWSKFLLQDERNPTASWFLNFPHPQKSLLIGDDNFLKFHEWKKYEEILENCHKVYVLPRYETPASLIEKRETFKQGQKFIILERNPYASFSSTKIREDS